MLADLLSITSFLVAVYAMSIALGAIYPISTIGWADILFNPRYIGGLQQLGRGFIKLIKWVFVSVIVSDVIAFVIYHLENLVAGISHLENLIGGGKDIVLTAIVSTWVYAASANKAKKILINRIDIEPTEQKIQKLFNPLYLTRMVFYIFPNILKNPLSYFIDEIGNLIDGCGRKLIQDYSPEVVVAYYTRNHRLKMERENSRKVREYIDNAIEKTSDVYQKALIITTEKIRLKGYNSVKRYLHNAHKDPNLIARGQERQPIVPPYPIELICLDSGCSYDASIINITSDQKGIFSSIEGDLLLDVESKYEIKPKAFPGVNHVEAKIMRPLDTLYVGEKVYQGYGMLADSPIY